MERKERVEFCKKCTKRKFSREKGLLCGITNAYATFEIDCADFEEDTKEYERIRKYQRDLTIDDKAVGGWIRFGNLFIDRIVHLGIVFAVGFVLVAAEVDFIFNLSRLEEVLLEWSIYVLYYIIMEYNFQVSVGKLITGTVVVDVNGKKPTLKAIVGRSFSRLVPFDAFSFLGSDTIGWHDTWSGTRVIKKKDLSNVDEDSLDGDIFDELN